MVKSIELRANYGADMKRSRIQPAPYTLGSRSVIALLGVSYFCTFVLIAEHVSAQSAVSLSDSTSFEHVVDFKDEASIRRLTERVPHRRLLEISRQRGPFIRGLCRALKSRRGARPQRIGAVVSGLIIRTGRSYTDCISDAPLEISIARATCGVLDMVVVSIEGAVVTCRRPNMT